MLKQKLGGVHLKHAKNTARSTPRKMPPPSIVRIPMQMHIGAPAIPTVKVGDEVKIGTLIGTANERLSSPVYSSVSGKVKKIEESKNAKSSSTFVVIESDGLSSIDDEIAPPKITSKQEFIDAVKKSGIVGLGGAGFPTYAKLNVPDGKIDTIVVNGAECEPYITSDTQTMIHDADDIMLGLEAIMKYLSVGRAVIGIEKNKPECIKIMTEKAAGMDIKVHALPSVYPQGGEKVLVYNTLGRIISEGKLPLDVGVIVINCSTLAAISKYMKTGMPLTEKCITVDGSAVKDPSVVIAPIGATVGDIIEFCGGYKEEPKKILFGGPMMGAASADIDAPILKQTNAIIALAEKDVKKKEISACIRCGKCAAACPISLSPFEIGEALEMKKPERLEKLKAGLCMECGCCSYVCPAGRELVTQNKLAKTMLRTYTAQRSEGGKK